MSVEENKALVRRLVEAWNTRNPAVLDELMVPNYVDHAAPPGQMPGREGYRQALISLTNAFPDYHTTVEDMIAEGDKVVYRWTDSGTHRGEFMGIAPTNKRVTFTGITIHRIVGGKLVERWVHGDILGFLQQLGVIPPIKGLGK